MRCRICRKVSRGYCGDGRDICEDIYEIAIIQLMKKRTLQVENGLQGSFFDSICLKNFLIISLHYDPV